MLIALNILIEIYFTIWVSELNLFQLFKLVVSLFNIFDE